MTENPTTDIYDYLTERIKELGFELLVGLARSRDNGKWDCNNDLTMAITEMGAVYSRKGRTEDEDTLRILKRLCPNGRGELSSPWILDMLKSTENLPIDCEA